jgi:hypothetical protein
MQKGLIHLVLFFVGAFFSLLAHAQWSTPDVSGNIHNTNLGNIGIGTQSPQGLIHIVQNQNLVPLILESSSAGWGSGMLFKNTTSNGGRTYGIYSAGWGSLNITDVTSGQDRISIGANGHVGINTHQINDPNNFLFVEGGIRCRKVTVDQASWPDYVFDSSYRLASLSQVERYIQTNHHLKDVPSADSIAASGVDLGSNQAALLKKIEELTLYIIDQDKKIEALTRRVSELKK